MYLSQALPGAPSILLAVQRRSERKRTRRAPWQIIVIAVSIIGARTALVVIVIIVLSHDLHDLHGQHVTMFLTLQHRGRGWGSDDIRAYMPHDASSYTHYMAVI